MTDTTVDISSADIKQLFTVPKVLVAAPGAGKILVLDWYFLAYKFGSVEYENYSTMWIYYGAVTGGNTAVAFIRQGLFAGENAGDYGPGMDYVNLGCAPLQSDWANKTLTLVMDGFDPITGDGTMKMTLSYRNLNLSDLWP